MQVYPVSVLKASLFKHLKTFITLFLGAFLLNACATTPTNPQGPTNPGNYQPPVVVRPGPERPTTDIPTPETTQPETQAPTNLTGLTPAFMDVDSLKRVAILLPFSAKSSRLRDEANSMLQAAELALFAREEDDVLLMAYDSEGTPQGAYTAANKAVEDGADIILGPILAASVRASGEVAIQTGTPMIGFSTDTSVAKAGVYLLSFPPEAEVKRVTEFVAESGARKFAFLGPTSRYGKRVLTAYDKYVSEIGGVMSGVETYRGNDITVMQEPAQRLAQLYTQSHMANEEREAKGLPLEEEAFHVVMLPEGGTALRSLAPLLPFFEENINASSVQFIGTGLWNKQEVVREPALRGGIFAGPDTQEKTIFDANYDAVFGEEPSRLASLAYDGVNIAAFVVSGAPETRIDRLTDTAGFFGVDGLVRFSETGIPERGLAIYQIKGGRFIIIDPAPKSTDDAL